MGESKRNDGALWAAIFLVVVAYGYLIVQATTDIRSLQRRVAELEQKR